MTAPMTVGAVIEALSEHDPSAVLVINAPEVGLALGMLTLRAIEEPFMAEGWYLEGCPIPAVTADANEDEVNIHKLPPEVTITVPREVAEASAKRDHGWDETTRAVARAAKEALGR